MSAKDLDIEELKRTVGELEKQVAALAAEMKRRKDQ